MSSTPSPAQKNLTGRLEHLGLRLTTQRRRVLDELLQEPDDATAQELHSRLRERGERVGLATVYRALEAFVEAGLVDELSHRPDERCYRACRSAAHHHHLVCSSCHRVVELTDCEVTDWVQRAAAGLGFTAIDHRLEVSGLCAECRRSGSRA